jgi:hypothetical protein
MTEKGEKTIEEGEKTNKDENKNINGRKKK